MGKGLCLGTPAASAMPSLLLERRSFLSATALFALPRALGQSLSEEPRRWLGPQHWEKQRNKPVLSLGKAGDFDDTHIFAPFVGKEGGRYFLWYPGSRGSVIERVFRIGLATSEDGVEFSKVPGGPVFEFGDGRQSILTPHVLRDTDGTLIREDGKLRMWFTAIDLRGGKHVLHEVTGAAPDRWSKPSPPLLRDCYAPTIVKDGGRYRMWYVDVAVDRWLIRHAQSQDGTRWSVTEAPVLSVDQRWEDRMLVYPMVVKADDLYLMWYASYWWWSGEDGPRKTAIGFAVSQDGLTWRKHPNNPVLRPDPELPWESHYNSSHSVIRLPDGSWRIWYGGRKEPPWVNKYFSINTAIWRRSG